MWDQHLRADSVQRDATHRLTALVGCQLLSRVNIVHVHFQEVSVSRAGGRTLLMMLLSARGMFARCRSESAAMHHGHIRSFYHACLHQRDTRVNRSRGGRPEWSS